MEEKRYKGIPVSAGIAISKIFVHTSEEVPITERAITPEEIPAEIARFEDALIATRKELLEIQGNLVQKLGEEHGEIFNAHLMFVEDRALIEEVLKRLYQEEKNVDYVFSKIGEKYVDVFSQMDDSYMRERASDVKDVVRRVMHNLIGRKREDFSNLSEKVIIVSYDLSPSDTALFHTEKVVAFATDVGTKTSHTAIMARSIGIPAIVGMGDVSREVVNGSIGIVDGSKGVLIVNPTPQTLEEYQTAKVEIEKFEAMLYEYKDLEPEMQDGHRIFTGANIEVPEDITTALQYGANAIGLYRTEYFYMNRQSLPTEAEHEAAYRKVGSAIPGTVIIRTFDLGGDKFASHIHMPTEMNPFLGCRGIRLCLARAEVFKVQLRGLLRASATLPNIKIMFPMVTDIEELRRAKGILEEAKNELARENVPFNEKIPVGILVETPSAAVTIDIIAPEVDFLSIGTNDLIQYSLAIDRVNPEVAYLYDPFHPAILRLLYGIATAAQELGIPVSVCGESGGDPLFMPYLLGIGISGLSTSPTLVPVVKKVVRSVKYADVQELSRKILSLNDPAQIKHTSLDFLEQTVPELVKKEGGLLI